MTRDVVPIRELALDEPPEQYARATLDDLPADEEGPTAHRPSVDVRLESPFETG